MFALPDWFVAGITFTVRLLPVPSNENAGINCGFEDLALTINEPAPVSLSPIVNERLVETSSSTVRFVMLEIVGRSLTEFTVSRNVAMFVAKASRTRTVIVAMPN